MKNKTIEKLRTKAIHALGGVMPNDVFDKPLGEIKEYTKFPERFRMTSRVYKDAPESIKQLVIQDMLFQAAKGMYERGMYELRTKEDQFGTDYEMTVEVIPLKCGDAQWLGTE